MSTMPLPPNQGRDAVWEEEKRIWGWLGRPPKDVLAFRETVARWRNLAVKAELVVKMPKGQRRTDAAKGIEAVREDIISEAKARAAERELRNAAS